MRRAGRRIAEDLIISAALIMSPFATGAAQAFGIAKIGEDPACLTSPFTFVAEIGGAHRGLARMRTGGSHGALGELNAALKKNPRDVEALFQRGNVQFRLNDRAAAIADYTRALALAPNRYEVLVARAHALTKQGDAKSAAADIDRAREIEEAAEKR